MPALFVTTSEAAGTAPCHKKSETLKSENGKNFMNILDPLIIIGDS
jgi:hypothetical protein